MYNPLDKDPYKEESINDISNFLNKIFNGKPTEQEYLAILKIFHDYYTERNLAGVMAYYMNKNYAIVKTTYIEY